MTIEPSLFFCVRCARVKASRSASLSGAGARHGRSFEEAGERCGADLGVARAVVLVLDPGLRGLVEEGERQVGHVLQPGDEAPFDGPQNASCLAF